MDINFPHFHRDVSAYQVIIIHLLAHTNEPGTSAHTAATANAPLLTSGYVFVLFNIHLDLEDGYVALQMGTESPTTQGKEVDVDAL